jgi:hypothetical protein
LRTEFQCRQPPLTRFKVVGFAEPVDPPPISTGSRSSFAELPSLGALFACDSGRSGDSCAK